MPTTTLMPVPKQQYFFAAGIPLIGGKVYTYAAGTNNPKQTFTDSAGTIPQANPIILNARGEPASAIFWSGNYKVEVRDALNNLVYTVDNYNTDPAGLWNIFTTFASSVGASLVGFVQAGVGAVVRTVQAELRDTVSVKQFGAVGGGVIDDTAAITAAAVYAVSAGKALRFPRGRYLISANILMRTNGILIDGDNSEIILGSSTAGFSIAGSHNHIKDLFFTQSSTAFTPLAIKFFNDATTILSIHNKATNCTGESVYQGIQSLMNVNGAGTACYRTMITDCVFQNFHLQKTWAGSFGFSFDGPNSGDAGGNDSRCVNCTVKGYQKNFLVNNSASTQFLNCAGDGAAANFSYEGGSSGLQVIGGYYEFNDAFIGVVGAQKYDAYIVYPSYGNNTAAITGTGIQFIFGGTYAGAPVLDIGNGAFKTYAPTGVAEIFASNGLKVYNDNTKIQKLNLSSGGEWSFMNGGRILVIAPGWVVTDKVEGYSGAGIPLDLKAGATVTMTTASTERVRVNSVGDILVPGAYASTTASAANMFVAADGTFQRSTSSGKYKTDVETLYSDLADAVFDMRPVWYRSTCETDRKEWSWYGLIAEEVAAIDPRLVHWGYSVYKREEVAPATPARDAVLDEQGNELEPAREASPAQFRDVPDTESALTPEGVQYDRLTVLLIDIAQRQRQDIQTLSERLSELELKVQSN